jgi:type II secretory pathway pseudopilin PulG
MSRRGVTLIELLIALAITMIMMGAVVTLFANMTTSVTDSRSVIEISERLRAARNLLQNDLMGHTAPATPPLDPSKDLGFIELIEGLAHFDGGVVTGGIRIPYLAPSATHTQGSGNSILGDPDDIVHLTVHSNDKPFTGIVNGVMMESQNAEIIWFALPNGRVLTPAPNTTTDGTQIQLYTLYRRVLLVLPGYSLVGAPNNLSTPASAQQFYQNYDLSAHYDSVTSQTVANTLGDLTKRENRFYHGTPGNNPPGNFPFQLNPTNLFNAILTGSRLGQDVVLDNVLAFDMRVYDPLAAMVKAADGTILGPSDAGYSLHSPNNIQNLSQLAAAGGMLGGFVDMAYAQSVPTNSPASIFFAWNLNSYFSSGQAMDAYSKLTSTNYSTFCTWSLSYEHDGIDQDGSGVADQGLNGFDDNSGPGPYAPWRPAINGIVDDPPVVSISYGLASNPQPAFTIGPGERETMSPYPYSLQAVEVRIRVYETDSRQVRQVTVVQDFVPE